MSDEWQIYPCLVGDEHAYICFDSGIAGTISENAPKRIIKLRLKLKLAESYGLPSREEFDELVAFEDQLEQFAKSNGDWYVGRITVAGQRHFYIYISVADHLWSNFVDRLSSETGYELSIEFRDDPEHDDYWQELFPSNDDWRIINDSKVIEASARHGDDLSASRRVEHWIYFDDEAAAKPFVAWAQSDRFTFLTEDSGMNDDQRYCVRLPHQGTMLFDDITSHMIALYRKARELGGDYDGWEVPVIKAQS